MKKILTFLMAALMSASLIALPSFKSVLPIDHASGAHFCTSWSLNKPKALYVTAAHCVADDPTHIPHMFTQRTKTIWESEVLDLAVIKGPVGVKALEIASTGPARGDKVTVVGYPLGMEQSVTFGNVMVVHQDVAGEGVKTLFAVSGATLGNSGSPILNQDGKVISVLQILWDGTGIVGGTPWEVIARVLGPLQEGG